MKCLTSGFVVDLAQIRAWKRLGLTNRAGHVGDSRIEAALLLDDVAVLFHLSCSRSASATPAALAARRGCGRGSPASFRLSRWRKSAMNCGGSRFKGTLADVARV